MSSFLPSLHLPLPPSSALKNLIRPAGESPGEWQAPVTEKLQQKPCLCQSLQPGLGGRDWGEEKIQNTPPLSTLWEPSPWARDTESPPLPGNQADPCPGSAICCGLSAPSLAADLGQRLRLPPRKWAPPHPGLYSGFPNPGRGVWGSPEISPPWGHIPSRSGLRCWDPEILAWTVTCPLPELEQDTFPVGATSPWEQPEVWGRLRGPVGRDVGGPGHEARRPPACLQDPLGCN